jgi:hypothetical protein
MSYLAFARAAVCAIAQQDALLAHARYHDWNCRGIHDPVHGLPSCEPPVARQILTASGLMSLTQRE